MARNYVRKITASRPHHRHDSALSPVFSFDDFAKGKLILTCSLSQQTCDPLSSTELEYIQFVTRLLASIKQKSHHPIAVLDDLRTHEMDVAGRFYVLDNLARVKKQCVQYKVEE